MEFPNKDTIEIVSAIIGLITSIIGLIKTLYEIIKKKVHISTKKFLYISFLSLITTIAAVFLWTKIHAKNIWINIPSQGSEVSIIENIQGECKNISSGEKIWIAVYSYSDNTYYPHHIAANIENDKRWNANSVYIGSSADRGKTFDIIPLLLDASAVSIFHDYVNNSERRGWSALPVGVQQFNKVEVKRR